MKTSLITAALAIIVIYLLTGCQVTVTARPDYEGWLELLETGDIPRAIIIPSK